MIGYILIMIWFITELIRYIYYCRTYRELNKPLEPSKGKNTGIDKFLKDVILHPEIFMENLNDIFYDKIKPEDMKYIDVCDALFFITNKNKDYFIYIKYIVKYIQLYYRKKYTRNIFVGTSNHKYIKYGHVDIKSWFLILPFYMIIKGFGLIIYYYANYLGYKRYIYPNKIRIWYRKYDNTKGTPLIYMHSSVGGISCIYTILKHFINNYNIIIPEIPGISFVESDTCPPNIKDISYTIRSFIDNIYINDIADTKIKFNLVGHSLGNALCISYINQYPDTIDTFFCIEGALFTHRTLKYFIDIEKPLITIPFYDFICIPVFYRNLYVQYTLIKLLSIENCFIYDNNNIKHINIIMFHSKTDDRILIEPQLKYARVNNIPLLYHIFNNDLVHGSFVLNKKMREYVIHMINNYYYK